MQDNDADLLFPPGVIASLRNLRGATWKDLVDRITNLETLAPDRLAFVLMMVRLGGCATCQADSFRAMRGCLQCASQTISRFRGDDLVLVKQFSESKKDILGYIREENFNG